MRQCVVCSGESTHKIAFTFLCTKQSGDGELEALTVMSKPFCEACIDTYLGYVNAEDQLEPALFMNLTVGIRKAGYLVAAEQVTREKQALDYVPPTASWEALKQCELCNSGTAKYKLVLRVPFKLKGRDQMAFIETGPMCAECTPTEPDANKHFNQEQLAIAFMEIVKIGGVYNPHKCQLAVMKHDWKAPEDSQTIIKDVASEAKIQRDRIQKAADEKLIELRTEVEDRKRKANNASNN